MANYPGDEIGWQVGKALFADYVSAGYSADGGIGVWCFRASWDIAVGATPAESIAKHQLEWRRVLDARRIADGLTPIFNPVPAVQPTDVGQLHVDSLMLRNNDWTPWFGLGVSAFTLLQAWLEGNPKVSPFLDWCQDNKLFPRVFGMYAGALGTFDPSIFGSRYDSGLDALVSYVASRGLRVKLSVFADRQNLPSIDPASFFDGVNSLLYDQANVLLDGGNEWSKNGWDPRVLRRKAGGQLLLSRGSDIADQPPPANGWDFFDVHPRRDGEWPRQVKVVQDIQTGQGSTAMPIPGGYDESIGIGETDELGRTTANPEDCFDFAAGAKLFGSFLVLHVRSAIALDLPGPRAQACVDQSRLAVRLVPDGANAGQYTRGGLDDCPLEHDDARALRTYGKILDNTATLIVIRPTPQWLARPRGDWKILEQRGPRENIILCQR